MNDAQEWYRYDNCTSPIEQYKAEIAQLKEELKQVKEDRWCLRGDRIESCARILTLQAEVDQLYAEKEKK
jgi:uncharacterized small protein (DUF1192 family)